MSQTLRMENGDIFVSPDTGKSETVDGPSKASQDIAEIYMTPLHTRRTPGDVSRKEYGSELTSIDVPPALSGVMGRGIISIKASEAIDRLRALQISDSTSTEDERIQRIMELEIRHLGGNDFAFWVLAETEAGKVAPERVLQVKLRHQQSSRVLRTLNNLSEQFVPGGFVG